MIDVHTHILPRVDDGLKDESEVFKVLEKYKEHGIDTVIFTPHINHPTIKTDISKIKSTYENLEPKFKELGIKTFLGSEFYLTPKIDNFIPIRDYFLLVELPKETFPLYLLDKIFELQLEGYEIILAHVERYKWLIDNIPLIERLKAMDVYFQMNLESLESDRFFIKNGLVEFIGTDYHGDGEPDFSLFEKYRDIVEKGKRILGL
ncbi:MAG: capsule biosynthesis protein CapC [Thermosipho sp. (in: Bacteria)]|nr:capsule biosynthesis protein CapC [Thermosipho sp. (in: thermotogales)]